MVSKKVTWPDLTKVLKDSVQALSRYDIMTRCRCTHFNSQREKHTHTQKQHITSLDPIFGRKVKMLKYIFMLETCWY